MALHHHTHPDALELYSFYWSEARLFIAAIALFVGGYPPIYYILPIPALYGIIGLVLKLAWLISGVAAAYLAYRWLGAGQTLFGQKDTKDKVAFFVLVVSGINLGLVGLINQNIGMTISSSYALFVLTGIIYLVAAYRLHARWKTSGHKMFKN